MAGNVPTAILSVFDIGYLTACGNREDLLDVVTIIESWNVPFFNTSPKGPSRSVNHNWLTDALAATSTAGAAEGAAHTSDVLVPRKRLQNICQIFRKDIEVSDSQMSENPAGITDDYMHQVMKAMREIPRNVESRVFALSATVSATGAEGAGAAGVGRVMKSFLGFVGDGLTVADASGAITSARVISLHKTMVDNGADPDTLYLNTTDKNTLVSALIGNSAANTRYIAAVDNAVVANIDIFETPFGRLAMVMDRFVPYTSTTASGGAWYLGDRSKARLAFFRPIQHVPLPKGGDSTRGFVRGELTLELLHPSSWAAGTGAS